MTPLIKLNCFGEAIRDLLVRKLTSLRSLKQTNLVKLIYYSFAVITIFIKSYFRSPDSKYVVFGGEDDLVNVYSLEEKRVVVRGQGHKSWVSVVAFDHLNISYGELPDGLDFSGQNQILQYIGYSFKNEYLL